MHCSHNVPKLWQADLKQEGFCLWTSPPDLSQRLKETFQEWIETLPNQEPKQVCDLFFDILDSGIESLTDIGIKTLPKLDNCCKNLVISRTNKRKVLGQFQPVALDIGSRK